MMTVDMPPRIEIEAQVVEYIPNAMTDHFEGNRFAVFDAAVLTVLAPADLVSRRLIIYQPQPAAVNSLWRRCGTRITFHIAPEMLAADTEIFEPAIHELSVKEDPEAPDSDRK